MKKVVLICSIVSIISAFAGAGYVLYHGGAGNAGYAVVPMVFSVAGISLYRSLK